MNQATGMESTRRQVLKALAGLLCGTRTLARAGPLPPGRTITRGPGHHWFGYYDKLQFDETGRYVLGMRVDFEHRSPTPSDFIQIGMVDLEDGDRWIELGSSSAWCWQQGCMLQWVPGSPAEILWNDREDEGYVCHILNVKTGKRRTLPYPVYTVSPDGGTAMTADFGRIGNLRPGYGYVGIADPYAADPAPEESGVFRVDLASGERTLVLSIARVARFGRVPRVQPGIRHYFNHLLFSPDGSRFVFLHRWRYPDGSRLTRMLTARPDGTDLWIVDDNGFTSHFIWRDPEHILAQSEQPIHGKANYLFRDRSCQVEVVGHGVLDSFGHCSYLPGGRWILSDTYPASDRHQNPHLYDTVTHRRFSLGRFFSPPAYSGEWRCDTHPRFSRNGKLVCIDSPHGGEGRQLHLIDISRIVS